VAKRKNKTWEEEAISEILEAETNLESGAEGEDLGKFDHSLEGQMRSLHAE
jgi:hypothetical protein